MQQSIAHLLFETIEKHHLQKGVQYKVGAEWHSLSWNDIGKAVADVAQSLIALDIAGKDRVCILSKTRLEWIFCDLGILCSGATTVPIYQSSVASDVFYMLQDSGAILVFAENNEQLLKVRQHRQELKLIRHIVCLDSDAVLQRNFGEISWAEFLELGRNISSDVMEKRLSALHPNDLATIVYTSGTSGLPKGAMISHSNLLYEADAIEGLGLLGATDTQLLFLPLAHIFARVLVIAWLKTAHVLAIAESIEKAVDNMGEVKPTFAAAVPRIYEKMQARVVANALAAGGLSTLLAKWAFRLAQKAANVEKKGRSFSSLSWRLAKKLVMKRVGERLIERFGGRMRFLVSGGAPLSPEIAYFFSYAGIAILEGYELSETCGATFVKLHSVNRLGTVGKPLPGSEVSVAEDGEILILGPGVFIGD